MGGMNYSEWKNSKSGKLWKNSKSENLWKKLIGSR